MIVTAGFRRFKAAAVASAIVVSGVLVGWSPLPIPPGGEVGSAAAAAPFGTPPPGVVGARFRVRGWRRWVWRVLGLRSRQELIRERQAREDRERVKPLKEGFDPELSVERHLGRSSHGTTFNNADGTQSTILAEHPVHYKATGGWAKIDQRAIPARRTVVGHESE